MRTFLRYAFGLISGLTLGCACTSDEHSLGGNNRSQMRDGGQDPAGEPSSNDPSPSTGGGGASGSPPVAGSGGLVGTGGSGNTAPSEIYPCPGLDTGPAPESDSVEILQLAVEGNLISFDVNYGGGCRHHTFGLCYGGLGLSYPAHVPVYVLHDANGDTCEGLMSETVPFDLSPLAKRFLGDGGLLFIEAWRRDRAGAAVSAGSDLYRSGDLRCEDRTFAAEWDTAEMEPPNTDCSTAQDCQWASRDTVCSRVCGIVVSTSGAAELSLALESISEETCGDGCVLPDYGTCPPPPSIDCVDGRCTAGP
jgi:hypothetical protein